MPEKTVQVPPPTPPAPRRVRGRFQFGLRGLLAAAVGVAVGCSTIHVEGSDWTESLLLAVATWLVLGLLTQAFDLARDLRARRDLPSDRRWALRFAVVWRVAIAAVLVGDYVELQLTGLGVVVWPEYEDAPLFLDVYLYDAPLHLALLVTVGSVVAARPRRRATWFSRLVSILAVVTAAAWCLYVCVDSTCVASLVFTAVCRIEAAQPPRFATGAVGAEMTLALQQFLERAWAAVGLVILAGVFLARLARSWDRGRWRRWLWGAATAGSLATASAFPVWLYRGGLRCLSPAFAEGLRWIQPSEWLRISPVAVIVVTIVTWRLSRRPVAMPESGATTAGEDCLPVYYHQRAVVLECLFLAMACRLIAVCVANLEGWQSFLALGLTPLSLLANLLLVAPPGCLSLAVLLLSLQAVWQRWRRPEALPRAGDFGVNPACFAAVWLGAATLLAVAAPTLTWAAFALWQMPGHYGFW